MQLVCCAGVMCRQCMERHRASRYGTRCPLCRRLYVAGVQPFQLPRAGGSGADGGARNVFAGPAPAAVGVPNAAVLIEENTSETDDSDATEDPGEADRMAEVVRLRSERRRLERLAAEERRRGEIAESRLQLLQARRRALDRLLDVERALARLAEDERELWR